MAQGVIRSLYSASLILSVCLLRLFPSYSAAFWLLAAALLIAWPALYIFLPELRNLGRDCGEYFFLPCQTWFYIALPDVLEPARPHRGRVMSWTEPEVGGAEWRQELSRERSLARQSCRQLSRANPSITFLQDTLLTLATCHRLGKLNSDRQAVVNWVVLVFCLKVKQAGE